MKTETTSTPEITKQAWTEPTLTTLALSLETHAQAMTGGDGMGAGTNLT
jgi:phenolic acid decarboxylase